jgi:hypothetical protein
MVSQEENLVLQSYFTVSLLAELGNNKFFSSDYFNGMNFGSLDIKNFLEKNGIDNQGSAVMSLYAMLVVPYELIRNNYNIEFSAMNSFLGQKTKNVTTTYHNDASNSDFMYHLRNAVAHCRISFKEGDSIVFADSNGAKKAVKKKDFYGELPLTDLGAFLHQLQHVIQIEVIKDIQAKL